jgi:DNA-binding LytR/AlgR family response regulator
MKCIAIDDEPIALSILREFCDKYGNIELRTFTSPGMGLQAVLKHNPDVLFLDIEMNGTSGIEIARQVPKSTCIIFTTAYAQYAIEGFEVDAVDFLHKPYFYERFERAMEKAEHRLQYQGLLKGEDLPGRQIVVKSDYKNVPVSINKIDYIESIDNYVRIHLLDGQDVVSKIPLHSVEKMVPEGVFVRIHRSYLVPISRIESFTRTEIVLATSGKVLPIGKTYADDVQRALCN